MGWSGSFHLLVKEPRLYLIMLVDSSFMQGVSFYTQYDERGGRDGGDHCMRYTRLVDLGL